MAKQLIDIGKFQPSNGVGNLELKGKYGLGYQVLKGDDLRQYLWDLTHKPYKDKFVIIDEADSEFPARSFTDKEQTEISLRLWHTAKLGNYIFLTSHIGNSTDIIMHLATHYFLYPYKPNFETNSMDFDVLSRLHYTLNSYTVHDIIKTMLIYNRQELTENTEEESNKLRPSLIRKNGKKQKQETIEEIDEESELLILNNLEV